MNQCHTPIKRIEVCHGPTCGLSGGARIKMILEGELGDRELMEFLDSDLV